MYTHAIYMHVLLSDAQTPPTPPGDCDSDERHAGWPDRAKERRRTEILHAAEGIAKARSWDAWTIRHVALRARLSRAFSQEFPARFEAIARTALRPASSRSECSEALTTSNEQACREILARAVERGVSDSSIRSDIGDSRIVSSVFWAFIHGVLQISMAKTRIPPALGLSARR
jgi:hypothetical protein